MSASTASDSPRRSISPLVVAMAVLRLSFGPLRFVGVSGGPARAVAMPDKLALLKPLQGPSRTKGIGQISCAFHREFVRGNEPMNSSVLRAYARMPVLHILDSRLLKLPP